MKIDEDAFIADVCANLRHGNDLVVPPGDDCAGIATDGDTILLMAVDQVVAGSHYLGMDDDSPTPPELAGRKLLARNLSDVAAMGGTPTHALTAIAWPKSGDRRRLDAFMGGIMACADEFNVDLIGGDLCASTTEASSLTIIGKAQREKLCLRTNARDGDKLFVTGRFGGSLASGRHLTFVPRVDEGQWLAEHGYTQCMIDVSDGLRKDVDRLCKASSLGATIRGPDVPVHQDSDLPGALTDGEDYELAFAVPADKADELAAAWPFETPLTEIGRFHSSPRQCCVSGAGLDKSDFSHFRA